MSAANPMSLSQVSARAVAPSARAPVTQADVALHAKPAFLNYFANRTNEQGQSIGSQVALRVVTGPNRIRSTTWPLVNALVLSQSDAEIKLLVGVQRHISQRPAGPVLQTEIQLTGDARSMFLEDVARAMNPPRRPLR